MKITQCTAKRLFKYLLLQSRVKERVSIREEYLSWASSERQVHTCLRASVLLGSSMMGGDWAPTGNCPNAETGANWKWNEAVRPALSLDANYYRSFEQSSSHRRIINTSGSCQVCMYLSYWVMLLRRTQDLSIAHAPSVCRDVHMTMGTAHEKMSGGGSAPEHGTICFSVDLMGRATAAHPTASCKGAVWRWSTPRVQMWLSARSLANEETSPRQL